MTRAEPKLSPDARDVIFGFFWLFSRFEYAIKKIHVPEVNSEQRATPDWKAAKSRPKWQTLDSDARRCPKASRLFDPAPRKQIFKPSKQLGWSDHQETHALDLVKHVRNNLFHGGKFPDGVVEGSEDDLQLIRAASEVLHLALGLDADFRSVVEHG